MRTVQIVLAATLIAAPAYAQQASGRITAKPALPTPAASAESKARPAAADAAITAGLPVVSADGQAVGSVFEVDRAADGTVSRVIIDARDGKQRAVPPANIRFEDGQAKLTLSRAQLIALPAIQP